MDSKLAHTLATQSLHTKRVQYRQSISEYNALLDLVENLPHVYKATELEMLTKELSTRKSEVNNLQQQLFSQMQIVSYLAGRLINEADTSNVQ